MILFSLFDSPGLACKTLYSFEISVDREVYMAVGNNLSLRIEFNNNTKDGDLHELEGEPILFQNILRPARSRVYRKGNFAHSHCQMPSLPMLSDSAV